MLPNTLEDVEQALDSRIRSFGTRIEFQEWESNDPDVVVKLHNGNTGIVINDNFQTRYPIVYRKAHEFSHLIFGNLDIGESYHFSGGLRNGEETIANQGAVRILCEIIYSQVTLEERSAEKFMSAFNLPSEYESIVSEAVYSA